MRAIFFETSSFTAQVTNYLTDDQYRLLQLSLLANPEAGDLMPDSGGFRKLRWLDSKRNKGKRGGLRVIYYWLANVMQFWMFVIYSKDEMEDLSPHQTQLLKRAITAELAKRSMP